MIGNTLAHSPAEVLRQLIIDLNQGSWPNLDSDWPVYTRQKPNEPDNLILTTTLGSVPHGRNFVTGESRLHFGAEVLVRSIRTNSTGTGGYTSGYEKIGLVCLALNTQVFNRIVYVSSYTYTVHAMVQTGDISDQGADNADNERYLFSVSYTMAITQH